MKRTLLWKSSASIIGVVGCAVVGVAEEPLVTDRPDFTESSSIVGAGISWRLGG